MRDTPDTNRSRSQQLSALALGVALAIQALRLWRSWCVFPWWQWNEIRLEPAFQLMHGGTAYPVFGDGPVGTWIYGPLSVVFLLPAAFATNTAGALLTAGGLTLALTLGTLLFVARTWPTEPESATTASRLVAFVGCLALWPRSAFEYIQADNLAIALGLLSNLSLARSSRSRARWGAAIAVAAALFSKQTAVVLVVAQLIWLARREGARSVLAHVRRLAVSIAVVLTVVVLMFGARGLWLNAVEIPARIPWVTNPAARVREIAPWLVAEVLVCGTIVVRWRARFFARASALSLATWSWLAALPLDVLSALKLGGSSNAFQGVLYLLPPALLAWCVILERSRRRQALTAIAALAAALGGLGIGLTWKRPWVPAIAHLRQAEQIAAQLPEQIWFPWNPLVTYFSDHRFYHAEDGLYVRAIAHRPLAPAGVRAGLPPHWSVTALATQSADWGVARQLAPAGAREDRLGFWTLQSWTPNP